MKLTKYYDPYEGDVEPPFHRVQISLHKTRGSDLYRRHDHTLDYVDSIKLNSALKSATGTKVARGYKVSIIKNNLKGTKHVANRQVLNNAGSTYIDLLHIHNAGAGWKRVNSDTRIRGSKAEWIQQWQEYLHERQQAGDKAINVTARRKYDNKTSFAIVWANPGKNLT